MTQVTAPTGITERIGYDGRGRKISLSSSTAGNFQYTPNGLGELISQRDARGWDSVLFYDVLGRKTERREFESAASGVGTSAAGNNPFITSWTYDAAASGTNCGSRTIGKLCTVSTTKNGQPNTRSSTQYDLVGRTASTLFELQLGADQRSFIHTTAYDANSKTMGVKYPGSVIMRNMYKT